MTAAAPDKALVTGFPTYFAKRLASRMCDAGDQVTILVRQKFADEAHRFVQGLGGDRTRHMRVLVGDVCDIDLGLAGVEYTQLAAEVTAIYHAAAVTQAAAGREQIERVNIDGTRTIIDLASESPKLRRLIHVSSAMVSGTRTGVVMEDQLDRGQRFRTPIEESRFEAERLVQSAARRLPTTIVRPTIIVGDSKTGEIDRFEGPYRFLRLILTSPIDVALPLPGRGSAPLHLVPIDFVIEAVNVLARDPRALGGTFHIADPSPHSARSVYELMAQRAERKLPRGTLPTGLARVLLRAPGLERLGQVPREILDHFDHFVTYNMKSTLALLDGAGVRCPSFDQYVDTLVRYVVGEKSARRQSQASEDERPDPFG